MAETWEDVEKKKAQVIELLSNATGYYAIRAALKQSHMLLREMAHVMEEDDFQHASNGRRYDTSDLMPCLLCNDHYPLASEYTRGIRYEPIPGKGWVYICWECVTGLKKVFDAQFNSLAYTFLFSLLEGPKKLREATLKTLEYTGEEDHEQHNTSKNR